MRDRLLKGPMAFAALGIVIALIAGWLTWDLSAIHTEQRVRYERTAADYAGQTAQRIERECGTGLQGQAAADCMADVIEASREDVRAERDLDAQEMMARFTRLMGWTGLLALIVGGASAGLIYATLTETRRMANDTREIGEAQVRAYLGIVVEHEPMGLNADLDAAVLFRVKISNVGQSPARRLRWNANVKYIRRHLPSNCPTMVSLAAERYTGVTLPVGDYATDTVPSNLALGEIFWNRAERPEDALYVFGVVTFSDVFGRDRLRRFAFRVEVVADPAGQHPTVEDGIQFKLRLDVAEQHNEEA